MLIPYARRDLVPAKKKLNSPARALTVAAAPVVARGLYDLGKYAYNKVRRSYSSSGPSFIAPQKSVAYTPKRKPRVPKRVMKKYQTPAIKELDKRIKDLSKRADQSDGELTYRSSSVGKVSAGQSLVSSTDFNMNQSSDLETVLSALKFYDSSTSTYVTSNPASSAKFSTIQFKKFFAKAKFRNNYQVPADLKLYWCKPKADTSLAPSTCLSMWATDNLITGAITDTQVYITDSTLFNDLWQIKKSEKVHLEPGQSFTTSYTSPGFEYDPAVYDSHNLAYQKKFEGCVLFLRLCGELGHDTAAAEYGLLDTSLEYQFHRTWLVEYDAGLNCKFVVSSQTGYDASWTNQGVVSNKPVSDNQGHETT